MKNLIAAVGVILSLSSISQAADSNNSQSIKGALEIILLPTGTVLSPFIGTYTISTNSNATLKKEIIEAQEDCAYFIATQGAVKTARIERILQNIRHNIDTGEATDLEIAYDILAFGSQAQ